MSSGTQPSDRFLYKVTRLFIVLVFFFVMCAQASGQKSSNPDSKTLGKALDYFTGGKYHEALMLMINLDKKYKLNPRFKAYIGICYYHEWEYKQACKFLDEAIPDLEVYAPHERNIYYNTAAESHFMLEEYETAIQLYEKQITVCHDNEKGDVFYRLGFCHMFIRNWQNAADYFMSAISYYKTFNNPDRISRIVQAENMMKGCEEKIKETE